MSSDLRVAMLTTCLIDGMAAEIGSATLRVLARLGVEAEVPEGQTCCGQIHINAGYPRDALALIHRQVEAFEPYDAVVVPSGSCAAAVRHQYAQVAAEYGDDALVESCAALAAKTYELAEFIVTVLGQDRVSAYYPHRVTFHPSCHGLRVLGIADHQRQLLAEVEGIDLVDLPDAEVCCGFGGTFALKNSSVSSAMLADKLDAIGGTKAEVCTAGDVSCLLHIGGGLSRRRARTRTRHLAEILDNLGDREEQA